MSVGLAEKIALHQVGDDFSVGFRGKLVAFFDQLLLQRQIVFDDAVVHHHDLSGAVTMRVSIFFSGTSVGGPARVADAVGAVERLEADGLFQVTQLALRSPHLDLALAVSGHSDPGGIIAAIFQLPEPFDDHGHHTLFAYISDDSTHKNVLLRAPFALAME